MRKIFVFAAAAALSLSMLLAAPAARAQTGPGGMMTGGGMMGNCQCMTGCGGMMGKGMMMRGMMMRDTMMAGIPRMTPEMRMVFMHAMMKTMIRSALQSPEIKSFLDKTAPLREKLVLKRFEYFEAFRNPNTPPARLAKLKAGIMALSKQIEEEMPHPYAGAMGPMMK